MLRCDKINIILLPIFYTANDDQSNHLSPELSMSKFFYLMQVTGFIHIETNISQSIGYVAISVAQHSDKKPLEGHDKDSGRVLLASAKFINEK